MLVTLLTKATTLKPDLPVFAPDFHARAAPSTAGAPADTNGHSQSQTVNAVAPTTTAQSHPISNPPTTAGASSAQAAAISVTV